MSLSNHWSSVLARGMFAVLMTLAWTNAVQATQAAASETPAAPALTDFRAAADRLERILKIIEADDRQVPRDTFDVDSILAQTGRDPRAILAWVRDHTRWLPYRGCLRGATGVLMDRLGSSLDRAVLLAEMLRRAGHTVRLAHRVLNDDQVRKYTSAALQVPNGSSSPAESPALPTDEAIARWAAQTGINPVEMRRSLDTAEIDAERRAELTVARVAEQTKVLSAAITSTQRTTEPSATEFSEAAARDRWWIQKREGDRWVDLDVMQTGAVDTEPPIAPDQTVPVPAAGRPIELPQAELHLINFRVYVEQSSAGKLETRQVLTATLRPSEIIGQPILFGNFPLDWPQDLRAALTQDDVQGRFKELVLRQHQWLPVLRVGKQTIVAASFDDAGMVNPKPDLGGLGENGKQAKHGGQATLDAFSPNPEARSQTPQGTLSGEWIEYEIRAPGREPQRFRRDIYRASRPQADRKGDQPGLVDADRLIRGMALLSQSEILPIPCQFTASWVRHLAAMSLAANRQVCCDLLRDPNLPDRADLGTEIGKLEPGPGVLFSWALLRESWSRWRNDICLQECNLACAVTAPYLDHAGAVIKRESFDIISNAVALRPGSRADGFKVGIEQGVLDTNLESMLISDGPRAANTAEMLSVSMGQGIEWVAVRDVSDPRLSSVELSEQARERIGRDLHDGYAVVVPTKHVTLEGHPAYGWWRINPRTGQLLGLMETGAGEAAVDFAFIIIALLLGFIVYCASLVFCVGPGPHTKGKFHACLACAILSGVLATLAVFAIVASPLWLGLIGAGGGPIAVFGCGFASWMR